MKAKIFLFFVIGSLTATNEVLAQKFLTLPLIENSRVMNGWYYRYCKTRRHYAIDYSTPVSQAVRAAADGVAIATESWVDNHGVGSYGKMILIRYEQTNEQGKHYMSVYAHLEQPVDYILKKSAGHRWDTDYENWTVIKRGEIIGFTGKSGTTWPHLHFETFLGDYKNKKGNQVDPYDLYSYTENYPDCGPNRLWLSCPPKPYQAADFSDDDGDGFTKNEGDCDDQNELAYPGAPELCNNIDDDCDGQIDEEPDASYHCRDKIDCTENYCDHGMCRVRYHHDACPAEGECTIGLCTINGCRTTAKDSDNDGYIDIKCGGDDCDDNDKNTFPGARELCDDKDNNCNGILNEGFNTGNDINNCGACGNVCPRQADNATVICKYGECLAECSPGWEDRDGNIENGCEYKDPSQRICTTKSECERCEVCLQSLCQPGIGAGTASLPAGCPCVEHDGTKDCGYGMWCGDPAYDGGPSNNCYSYSGGCVCSHF